MKTPVYEATMSIGSTTRHGHIHFAPVATIDGPAFEWSFYESYNVDWEDDDGVEHTSIAFEEIPVLQPRRFPDFVSCVADARANVTIGDPVEQSDDAA